MNWMIRFAWMLLVMIAVTLVWAFWEARKLAKKAAEEEAEEIARRSRIHGRTGLLQVAQATRDVENFLTTGEISPALAPFVDPDGKLRCAAFQKKIAQGEEERLRLERMQKLVNSQIAQQKQQGKKEETTWTTRI